MTHRQVGDLQPHEAELPAAWAAVRYTANIAAQIPRGCCFFIKCSRLGNKAIPLFLLF